MALSAKELQQRLNWLAGVIREAGQIILKYYSQETRVDWKAPEDPITAADRASNNFLIEKIREAYPQDAILSEESIDDRSRFERPLVWMIDPMDGTKEFINRNGEFSVMVGLVQEGKPVMGAIYQPTEDRLYLGAKGIVARLEENGIEIPLRVSDREDIATFRMVVSRSHLEPVVEDMRVRLGITDFRQSGSVGLKCGLIARGECDLYIHPSQHAKLWDSCAPQAVLEAAGGIMTDIYGNPLDYTQEETKNMNGLLASNGKAHDKIVELIQKTLQEA
ncbi:MAG: 3'(2'),5'-bisphosphate nucleotidase CysQ [Calditrichaeota bacterium]|nr:MAG: 3'(2'),5'-bisphosphate nucleotidase CysQ [Calditrichota bacterium]